MAHKNSVFIFAIFLIFPYFSSLYISDKFANIDTYFTPVSKGFFAELQRRKMEICSCTPCCYICPCPTS
ncbi:unnamed protein product [Withania somnifera]